MNYTQLAGLYLFDSLPITEIEALIDGLHHQLRKYESGQVIAVAGEVCSQLLILCEGMVEGEMIDFNGKKLKIEDISSPNLLASAFLFGRNNRFPVNIVALSHVEILCLPKDSVLRMFQSNTRILANYLDIISNRAQFLSQKLKFQSFQTIKGKIASYLLNLAAKQGAQIALDRSQNELAELFGVARPSLARAMSELNDEGILLTKGRQITVLNPTLLKELIR